MKSHFPMLRYLLFFIAVAVALVSCGNDEHTAKSVDDFRSRSVTLPDGTAVKAEVLMNPADMARGMMFRDTLPPGRGVLFIHGNPNKYQYWMYQTKVPLDIIWMDVRGKVVEVSENTPPCTTPASQCPNYGGNVESSVVLELPAGYASAHGVRVGAVIRF